MAFYIFSDVDLSGKRLSFFIKKTVKAVESILKPPIQNTVSTIYFKTGKKLSGKCFASYEKDNLILKLE